MHRTGRIARQGGVNASCLCFGQTLLQDVTCFRLFAQVGTQLLALLLHVLHSPDQIQAEGLSPALFSATPTLQEPAGTAAGHRSFRSRPAASRDPKPCCCGLNAESCPPENTHWTRRLVPHLTPFALGTCFDNVEFRSAQHKPQNDGNG